MAQAISPEYAPTIDAERPVVRKIALYAIALAAFISLSVMVRELLSNTPNVPFVTFLGIASLTVFMATVVAVRKQDESFAPKWEAITYGIVIGAAIFVPMSLPWASQMNLGLTPALMPGLALFICLAAPLAIPNQVTFGLGSVIPKCLVMMGAIHFTDNTNLGILSNNYLLSPQTAICAIAVFTAISSVSLMFAKCRLSPWLMFLIGLLATLPCILKIETCLVIFHAV